VNEAVKALPDDIEKKVTPHMHGVGDKVEAALKKEAGLVSDSSLKRHACILATSIKCISL
jgi:hypothetical protein